jgi:hypothetical protein
MPDDGKTTGLGTHFRRRPRRPGDTLIEFELELGLSDQAPVRRGLGRLVPGGWVSCAEAANDQTRMVWAGTQAEQAHRTDWRSAGACGRNQRWTRRLIDMGKNPSLWGQVLQSRI